MNNIKLSVLICSVPSRIDTFLPKIFKSIEKQATKDVEIIVFLDNKKRSVGQKRNDLLALAQGTYVVFVDDDDEVTDDYVSLILKGVNSGADVVNFGVNCSVNGSKYKRVYYDARYAGDTDHTDHYKRMVNHIMCVKRELALQVGFPDINFSEDADYAKRLRPHIKSQAFIDKVLYFYNFSHQISETQ